MAAEFKTFGSWAEVLAAIDTKQTIYYQAPMDYRPVHVACTRLSVRSRVRLSQRVRVYPPAGSGADPFTADSAHLERFKYRAPAAAVEVE